VTDEILVQEGRKPRESKVDSEISEPIAAGRE